MRGRKGVEPYIVHERIDNNLLEPSDLTGHVDKEGTTPTSTSTTTSSQKEPKNVQRQHLKKKVLPLI